ncbi:Fucoxanthin-chlorophyll a-c binding protein E, chloroplastic [Symbiodinium microadriaticum]|uniref:Fucoxanthin-chlorophyll a-c binding protein E, chloroplastic n=1 Tax=Symbiodinium microadriaticum TaxID=2951 RepID=A0A1Q9D687_SYMMI|nr:Fucoxanthin-chlorophyll a-c binding protein E, chloroplastic [Symbiodinium microadriaticum]
MVSLYTVCPAVDVEVSSSRPNACEEALALRCHWTIPAKDDAIGQPQPKDGGDAEKFDRYRGAALQHDRVAMLAVVGVIAQHSYRFPFVLTEVFGG